MQRELKFRAWDGKKIHQWDSVNHGAVDKITGTPYPKLYYLPMSWLAGDSNDWIWMQFTGLKDKNGKEIYEGDIVHFRTLSKNRMTYEVRWSDAKTGFKPTRLTKTNKDEIEVIGNIYENPNLITNNY